MGLSDVFGEICFFKCPSEWQRAAHELLRNMTDLRTLIGLPCASPTYLVI
jgi:hypothetical protein